MSCRHTAEQQQQLTSTALSTWLAADILGSSDRDLCGFSILCRKLKQSLDEPLKQRPLPVMEVSNYLLA